MIQARWLQRSCHPLKNGHRQVNLVSKIGRNFSSAGIGRPRNTTTPIRLQRTLLQCQQRSPSRSDGRTSIRFASTNANSSPVADIQLDFAPSSTADAYGVDFTSTSLDDVTTSIPSPVYDHMGFLKEMGLDYGWGTTAMMETLIEFVHINAGTPWWATIGLSLVIVRLLLLKGYFAAADTSARNQLIEQYNAPIMERMKAAQRSRDQAGVAKAWREMKDLRASAGVKYWKLFVPFIQIPIGFGAFRLMRGVSYLPVPGLDTGGPLWMQDLTLSDPYFILPILTAASYYYTFKVGGETGTGNALMTPTVRRIFLYVLPPFSGLIMCAWPGALQLTFFIQAMISMVQSAALRQDWFRNLVGIQPLPKPGDTKPNTPYSRTINKIISVDTAPGAKKGIFGGAVADIKSAISSAKKRTEEYQQPTKTGRRTPGELKHAQAYDARRRREIAQEKFERDQLKEEKRRAKH